MGRHCADALELAKAIEGIDGISMAKYPFLSPFTQLKLAKKQMKLGGSIVTIVLEGELDHGKKCLDSLGMITLSANLGDTRTIATHPASTTHSKLTEEERQAVGINDGMIRISVGLGHAEDIIEDIKMLLRRADGRQMWKRSQSALIVNLESSSIRALYLDQLWE